MKFPQLNVIKKNTEMINELMGHDHRNVINDGFFYDTLNMCNDSYPTIRTRDKFMKSLWGSETVYHRELVVADKLYAIIIKRSGNTFNLSIYNAINEEFIIDATYTAPSDHKPQITGMSDRIVFFPAKFVYDCQTGKIEDIGIVWNPGYNCSAETYSNIAIYFSVPDTGSKKIPSGVGWYINAATESADIQEACEFLYTHTSGYKASMITTETGAYFASAVKIADEVFVYPNENNNADPSISGSDGNTLDSVTFGETTVYKKEDGTYGMYFGLDIHTKKAIPAHSKISVTVKGTLVLSNVVSTSVYMIAQMLNSSGNPIETISESSTAPENPTDGQYWLDLSQTPSVLKVYSSSTSQWSQVLSAKYMIKAVNETVPEGFKVNDTVTFNTKDSEGNVTIEDLQGDWAIKEIKTTNGAREYIVIEAVLPKIKYEMFYNFSVERQCPDLDYICVCENRVWGCNSEENEIHACALGDPFNWYAYENIASDSYELEVASDGKFTGCCTYSSSVVFFKQDTIHRIYGTKPSNYAIKTFESVEGIAEGASKSAALVGGVIYYKGVHGIYAFDGNYPQKLSDPFGNEIYTGGVGGQFRYKYLIHMNEASFVYDSQYNTWQKISLDNIISNIQQHNTDAFFFTWVDDKCYLNSFDTICGEEVGTLPAPSYKTAGLNYVCNGKLYSCEATSTKTYWKYKRTGQDLDVYVYADKEKPVYQDKVYYSDGKIPIEHFEELTGEDTVIAYTDHSDEGYYHIARLGDHWEDEWGYDQFAVYRTELDEAIIFPVYEWVEQNTQEADKLSWLLETGDLALAYTNHKWVSKVIIRAEMEAGATFNVDVSYDGSAYTNIYSASGQKDLNLINLPIVSRRCDHMRFKLYGVGNVRIYAISKDIETGSEI